MSTYPSHEAATVIRDRRWRTLLRLMWVPLAVLTISIVLLDVPHFYTRVIGQTLASNSLLDLLGTLGLPLETVALLRSVVRRAGEFGFLLMGVLLFYYRSDDRVALLLSLTCLCLASSLSGTLLDVANNYPILKHALVLVGVLGTAFAGLLMLVLPDGEPRPRAAGWLLVAVVIWDVIRLELDGNPAYDLLPRLIWFTPVLTFMFFGLVMQLNRYQDGGVVYRYQIRWVLLGVVAVFVGILATQTLLMTVPDDFAVLASMVDDVTALVLIACLAVAVLRYKLYSIHFMVNRAMVTGAVTVALGAVGLAAVLGLRLVLGDGLALALAALVVGALFVPTHRRVRAVVDRRIYGLRFGVQDFRRHAKVPPATHISRTGQLFDDYRIVDVIGRGGMGEVYLGTGRGRQVAIKLLAVRLIEGAEARVRFHRELRALARLRHENIVNLLVGGEQDGTLYLVTEYLPGVTLAEHKRVHGKMPLHEALDIITQLLDGLAYAHGQGVLHRDIKADNIILVPQSSPTGQVGRPRVVLLDFGLVKLAEDAEHITGENAIGTVSTMPPEQILGKGAADARSDVYSVGVLLYEMLTGRTLFEGSVGQQLFAHLHQPAPDPRLHAPHLSNAVAEALLRALEKSPANRYPDATAFKAALLTAAHTPTRMLSLEDGAVPTPARAATLG